MIRCYLIVQGYLVRDKIVGRESLPWILNLENSGAPSGTFFANITYRCCNGVLFFPYFLFEILVFRVSCSFISLFLSSVERRNLISICAIGNHFHLFSEGSFLNVSTFLKNFTDGKMSLSCIFFSLDNYLKCIDENIEKVDID